MENPADIRKLCVYLHTSIGSVWTSTVEQSSMNCGAVKIFLWIF